MIIRETRKRSKTPGCKGVFKKVVLLILPSSIAVGPRLKSVGTWHIMMTLPGVPVKYGTARTIMVLRFQAIYKMLLNK